MEDNGESGGGRFDEIECTQPVLGTQDIGVDFLPMRRWNKTTLVDLAFMNVFTAEKLAKTEEELTGKLIKRVEQGGIIVPFPVFEDGASKGEWIGFEKYRAEAALEKVVKHPDYIGNACASPVWQNSSQGWFIIAQMLGREQIEAVYQDDGYYLLKATELLTRKRKNSTATVGNGSTPGLFRGGRPRN